MKLKIKKIYEDAQLPKFATESSAGMDLVAYIDLGFTTIEPGEWKLIHTGIAIQGGYGIAWVCPRSGLALKHGISVLNSPGVVDADYQGEVGVILMNNSKVPFRVNHGDRIGQLVFGDCYLHKDINFEVVKEFDSTTERGEGGFGHTGK